METLLSIIVPCVDMPKMTKKCVELVWQNTPPVDELIIVCDRPSEGMKQWLSSLEAEGKAKVAINRDPVGASSAINMGFKTAKGKYIAVVCNDVEVTAGWLQPLLQVLECHPEYGWVASRVIFSDTVMTFGCPLSLYLREALEKVGLFDEESFSQGIGAEDDDLYRRFLLAGYEPHGVASSVAYHPYAHTTLQKLHGEKHSQSYLEKYKRNREILSKKWNIFSPGTNWDLIPWV